MSACILAASNLAPRSLDMPRDYACVLGESRTILNRPEQAKEGRNRLTAMARKRVKPDLEAFGLRLAELRGGRSRQAVSNALAAYGVSLDESTLHGYEKGRVWSVDVAVALGLARVFDVPFSELAALLIANRADADTTNWVDLLSHSNAYQSLLPNGGADVPVSAAQARRLEQIEAEHEKKLAEVEAVSRELFRIVRGRAPKAGEIEQETPQRRGPAGKTHRRRSG